MCKKNTYVLHVSNRGAGVTEVVTRTRYRVNVPTAMRNGKMSMITVLNGTIAIQSDNTVYHSYNELGVYSNLPILGFDTETANGFNSEDYNRLFHTDLTTYHTNDINLPTTTNQSFGAYRCGSLPERFEFTRYNITTGAKSDFATEAGDSDYIAFTLLIEFDD